MSFADLVVSALTQSFQIFTAFAVVDQTQSDPPKTEKSRPNPTQRTQPNPWVNPTHGQLSANINNNNNNNNNPLTKTRTSSHQ